jgi:hypothetical protein
MVEGAHEGVGAKTSVKAYTRCVAMKAGSKPLAHT